MGDLSPAAFLEEYLKDRWLRSRERAKICSEGGVGAGDRQLAGQILEFTFQGCRVSVGSWVLVKAFRFGAEGRGDSCLGSRLYFTELGLTLAVEG